MTDTAITRAMADKARAVGISASVIAGIESGAIAGPSLSALGTVGEITREQAASVLAAGRAADTEDNARWWGTLITVMLLDAAAAGGEIN